MGKALGKFLGVSAPTPSKPTKFGGGFSGATLSDMLGEEDPLNGATGARHQKQLTDNPFRHIVFGHTAMSLQVVYHETYNGQRQYDEVLVAAGHEIAGFDGTLLYDGEVLTFDGSGNNNEDFGSDFNFKTRTLGVTGTTLACGAGSIWTSTSSLTGCAFFTIRTTFDNDLFPDGVSMNYMVPGTGALVYDPRNGGHDPADQTTWEYNDGSKDIGRNPALQILWYLLGWKEINSGIITCGKGVDPDDIDMASFIAAANDYDTLGWFSDCVLSMGDTDSLNLSILKSGCGATLTDAGGLYSIHAPMDDTATVAFAFDENHLHGDNISWFPKVRMQAQFNSVSGTFIDSDTYYVSRPYPKVEDATYVTADGFAKNKTRDYQSVQDSDQAQELLRIELNQTRFQGILTMAVNQSGLVPKHYDVVTVTNAEWEFVNKKFRVKKQGVTTQGFVELELQETDTSIYTGGTVNTLPAAPAGTAYDNRTQFTVAGLAVAKHTETGSGPAPTISDGLKISWTDPTTTVAWTELRYKRSVESVWLDGSTVVYGTTESYLTPLESNTQYDVQARHRSVGGVLGAWSSTVQQTTDGVATRAVTQNAFPNAGMDSTEFISHLAISPSTGHELVSATTEGLPTPPANLGDSVLQVYDSALSSVNQSIFTLDSAGWSDSIEDETFTWGFYYINTDADEDIELEFGSGPSSPTRTGVATLVANTTAWTWVWVTDTVSAPPSLWTSGLKTIPAAGVGKAYITGVWAQRGAVNLTTEPTHWGSVVVDENQLKVIAGWDTIPESASTVGATKYADYTALRAATAGGDSIVSVVGKPDFKWDATSTELDNGWTVIIPDSITHPAAGRWLMQLIDSGVFDASWDESWVPDYVPDDTSPTGTDMHAVLQAQSDWLTDQIVQDDTTTGKRQALRWIIPYHAKLTDTLKVRAGIEIDTRGVLYNHLSDTYEFMIWIMPGAQVANLNFWARNGGGVQVGAGAKPFSKYTGSNGLVDGASQTGGSLVTDGWSNSTFIAADGDWIVVDGNDYQVTADATSNGSGQVTFSISPDLVSSPANNDPVAFVGVLNDININSIRGWAVGESAFGTFFIPGHDQQVGIYMTGFNIEYDHIEVDGGNVGIDFNNVSDIRGGYALSVTASTGFRITSGSEQLDWGVVVVDSPNFKGFKIDSSSNFSGEIRCFFNESAFPTEGILTSLVAGDIGQDSSGDPVQHYSLKVDLVNTDGVGVKFWYTERGFVDILCSETALHTTETSPTTYAATYDATGFTAARQETMMINIVGEGSSGIWSGGRPTGLSYLSETNGDTSFYGNLVYFDQANNRLGVGTASPGHTLHVGGNAAANILKALGNGGAGGPVFTRSSDLDTGMYFIGADQLGFTTGGTLGLSIDATQNVAIPNGNLRITGDLGVNNTAAATTLGSVTDKMEIFDEAGASVGFIPIYDAIT